MHSRILILGVIAAVGLADVCWPRTARAAEWFDGQEVLIDCPRWSWEASQLSGIVYELCFDDFDQCTVADIGDAVCIPGLGEHDVWVTAIDYQGADPVYYDGEIASISRVRSSDFDGDALVGFADLFHFLDALTKCVSETGSLYEAC